MKKANFFKTAFAILTISVFCSFFATNTKLFAQEWRYEIIEPVNPFPQLGLWVTKPVEYATIYIDGCKLILVAEWSCRIAHDGTPEILITRLAAYAETEECFNKIGNYIEQLKDKMTFKLALRADLCFPFLVGPCIPGQGLNEFFRVYYSTCGHETTIRIDDLRGYYKFEPCDINSFCRLKYSYCLKDVDGVIKIIEKVEKEDVPLYDCPPYTVLPDGTHKQCEDENCALRKNGYFIIDYIDIIEYPDIDHNPGQQITSPY